MAIARISTTAPSIQAGQASVFRLAQPAVNQSTISNNAIFDIARQYASEHRFVAAGTELIAEGETSNNLYVVLDGWLILDRILEDGRRQILDFALPGTVVGFRVRPDMAFTFTAEAITDAKVAVLPISRVRDLLHQRTDCALALLEAANDALLGAFDTLTDVGRRTAREAVSHFLLRMDRRIRRMRSSDVFCPVPFPLTQEHIGDALGLTAVHVCRTLRALRADGLIKTGRGSLTIFDREALADEAGAFSFEGNGTRLAS